MRASFIIATRNRAEFLAKTLDNVREFLTPDDELLIVDGGSTDATADVVAKNRDLVTYFESEPDRGEAHAQNKGLLLARGRFIKPLTDDDYIYPDAMRAAFRVLDEHPEIDALVCGGEQYRVDPDTGTEHLVEFIHLPADRILRDSIDNVVRYAKCGVGLVLRRSVIARVGLFDTTFISVDSEYMARLVRYRVNFAYLNIKLFRLKTHSHSRHDELVRIGRELLRIRIRYGEWPRSWVGFLGEPMGQTLGLWDVQGGREMTRLVSLAEQARAFRHTWILRGAAWVLGAALWVRAVPARLVRALGMLKGDSPAPSIAAEPVWDGRLR